MRSGADGTALERRRFVVAGVRFLGLRRRWMKRASSTLRRVDNAKLVHHARCGWTTEKPFEDDLLWAWAAVPASRQACVGHGWLAATPRHLLLRDGGWKSAIHPTAATPRHLLLRDGGWKSVIHPTAGEQRNLSATPDAAGRRKRKVDNAKPVHRGARCGW